MQQIGHLLGAAHQGLNLNLAVVTVGMQALQGMLHGPGQARHGAETDCSRTTGQRMRTRSCDGIGRLFKAIQELKQALVQLFGPLLSLAQVHVVQGVADFQSVHIAWPQLTGKQCFSGQIAQLGEIQIQEHAGLRIQLLPVKHRVSDLDRMLDVIQVQLEIGQAHCAQIDLGVLGWNGVIAQVQLNQFVVCGVRLSLGKCVLRFRRQGWQLQGWQIKPTKRRDGHGRRFDLKLIQTLGVLIELFEVGHFCQLDSFQRDNFKLAVCRQLERECLWRDFLCRCFFERHGLQLDHFHVGIMCRTRIRLHQHLGSGHVRHGCGHGRKSQRQIHIVAHGIGRGAERCGLPATVLTEGNVFYPLAQT